MRIRVPISFGEETLGPMHNTASSNVLKLVIVVQHGANAISGFADLGLVQLVNE